MSEEESDNKSVFRQKVELEKKKFWDIEGEKGIVQATDGGDNPTQKHSKNKKNGSNILLFVATFVVSIAIFAFILFNVVG